MMGPLFFTYKIISFQEVHIDLTNNIKRVFPLRNTL